MNPHIGRLVGQNYDCLCILCVIISVNTPRYVCITHSVHTQHILHTTSLYTTLHPIYIYTGYEKAAKIAKKAHTEETTLKEAALGLGYTTEAEFDAWIRPADMCHPLP